MERETVLMPLQTPGSHKPGKDQPIANQISQSNRPKGAPQGLIGWLHARDWLQLKQTTKTRAAYGRST